MNIIEEVILCRKVETEAGARRGCVACRVQDGEKIHFRCSCSWKGEKESDEEVAWDHWIQHIILDKGAFPDYPDF